MIDLKIDEAGRKRNIERCKQKGILLPTYEQMRDPSKTPQRIKDELKNVGLWDVHTSNLFRVTWKNEPKEKGGQFGDVNYLELPRELTNTKAKIAGIAGKWFPTGAHKVGAAYSCLISELVTGRFDPSSKKAVWPSTGNYCRGGAYISRLLSCPSVAILPAGMSKERFEWLRTMAEEVIATPGCESNVKEIFDKCIEIEKTRPECVIFNQFDQLPNHLWHFSVTGPAMEEVYCKLAGPKSHLALSIFSSGSAGTLGAGSYLKTKHFGTRVGVGEALQCPTVYENGYGDHRIEGIGDKHIPWIHNLRDTDVAVAVDDEITIRLLRLFNEPAGQKVLFEHGVSQAVLDRLELMGISGIGNLVATIKAAKYYELTETDVALTVFTDSLAMYGSRLVELTKERGPYTQRDADRDLDMLQNLSVDYVLDMTHAERRRVHNLKYYTWIEQLGKDLTELRAQWDDHHVYWDGLHAQAAVIDKMITEFNAEVLK
ncbi:MAG: pyridoxal-5-phosphate-dependent protein subunit beta [Spirochaetes bacterium GWD1_61_31]|nr:MAG: pyridoxal-5-phosphate-dependent protein subunit beta [Spirochaetes bacterium GWB1_60_80]OHD40557.1 MAG: pyridoxal-5-phosphate-dependent protein subunit beta [Spirochaetes bacterium GWD1_61_31]OHD44058.1 MAG: pyridoxal-5-phosphate-dependent protein subunit beta [Spirochaetes bacterium GWE1_60_18]OHD59093.1 MAG: pyridoxal-5-phosphate-dependent protein subunit beta [Spirochaetes bacterium GWF1_60_12]HAP44544.1 pyridoxal-5-phosphate-dependent protein subunit beta [Spirochaetaceae bacterium]